MDYREADQANKMVKMTLKRADSSIEDERWICKKIEVDSESALKKTKSLHLDENLEESDGSDNWRCLISSHLEIDLKEGNSTEYNADIKNIDMNREINDTDVHPIDLSKSHSILRESLECIEEIDPCSSSIKAHGSKGKFLGNDYGCDAIDLTKGNRLKQDENGYFQKDAFPRNSLPMEYRRCMDSGEEVSMAQRGGPSTSHNYPLDYTKNFTRKPYGDFSKPQVSKEFVNRENSEITTQNNIPEHLKQRTVSTDASRFGTDVTNEGHFRNDYHSSKNTIYDYSTRSVDNVSAVPSGNMFVPRTGDNFFNNFAQKYTSTPKRPSENSSQIDSGNASNFVCLPKKVKSSAKVNYVANYCAACNKTFKSIHTYTRHMASEKHRGRVPAYSLNLNHSTSVSKPQAETTNRVGQHRPILYQSTSVSKPGPGPTDRVEQQQSNLNQSISVSNSQVELTDRVDPEQSNLNQPTPVYNSQAGPADRVDPKQSNLNQPAPVCKPLEGPPHFQPPRPSPYLLQLMQNSMWNNLSHVRPMNPRALFYHPYFGPSTSMADYENFLNPIRYQNYLGTQFYSHNLGLMPFRTPGIPQGIIMPSNNPNSTQTKPQSLENIASPSSHAQRPPADEIRRVPSPFLNPSTNKPTDFFQTYYCMVCLKFSTYFLLQLEKHLRVDRSYNSRGFIVLSGKELVCKLCFFKTAISQAMTRHCEGDLHMNRVSYYNHVMEGGLEKLETFKWPEKYTPVLLFCAACDFTTESLSLMKTHEDSRSHFYNVSCCTYLETFSTAIEHCFCILCNFQSLTKSEFLKHVRSASHQMRMEISVQHGNVMNAREIFYVKEKDLNSIKRSSIPEPSKGDAFIQTEDFNLAKEKPGKPKEDDNIENSAQLKNLAPSASSNPLPIRCTHCQDQFSETNDLVQHLQGVHGVNKAGVKWVVSAASQENEQKLLPNEELANRKAREFKMNDVSPEATCTIEEKLCIERMNINSSPCREAAENCQNVENQPSLSPKCEKEAEKSVGASGHLSPDLKANTTNEAQCMQGQENMDPSPISYQNERKRPHTSPSKKFNKTKNIPNLDKFDQNYRSDPDGLANPNSSSIEEFRETNCTPHSCKPVQNLDLHQERSTNIDSNSRQQLCETGDPDGMPSSNSEQFYETEDMGQSGKPVQNLDLHQVRRISMDSASRQQFYETKDPNERASSNSSSTEPYYETEETLLSGKPVQSLDLPQERNTNIDFTSREQFSETEDIFPIEEEYVPSEERLSSVIFPNEIMDEHDSESNEDSRYDANLNDFSTDVLKEEYNSDYSDDSKYRTKIDASSSDQFSSTETGSLISNSALNIGIESIDSLSSDDISITYENLPNKRKPISQTGKSMVTDRSQSHHHYIWDSQNQILSLEDQPNLSENVEKHPPIYRPMTLAELKRKVDNRNSIIHENSEVLVEDPMDIDCPYENETEFSSQNSPVVTNPEIQVMENIEISSVFSLKDHNSFNIVEEEENSDFDLYSDL